MSVPVLSVFGSCRVYDPAKLLDSAGRVSLNQQNIFGFVHNSREVLQQIGMLTGATEVPRRLRPFLNIPERWTWEPRTTDNTLDHKFAHTDCFVVEISSIRLLRFKAMYLQLNRTRELLAADAALDKVWWTPLIRDGRNNVAAYPMSEAPGVHREIVEQLSCSEQSGRDVLRDARAIAECLPRPVLFVSHFNATETGTPIRQRQMIVDALNDLDKRNGTAFWDPTEAVLSAGAKHVLKDAAHYNPEFLPALSDVLYDQVSGLLARTPERRILPDRYEFTLD